MSLSQTGAPCLTCVHGSICPHRDDYMKFYTHRDQVMCKTNDHSMGDDLNTVDPSNRVTVYVEHRYLNGPALDQLYQDLGLGGPSYCCLVPQNRCPLSRVGAGECFHKNYYDSPVLSKWNAPLGYISPLCAPTPERWEANKFLPQKRPLPDMCNSCAIAKGVKPGASAELVGTPYSTFQVTQYETERDSVLFLKEIPIPSMLHAGYERSYVKGTEVRIEDESTRVVCYYDWRGPGSNSSETTDPHLTEQEITDAKLRTRIQILSGDAALTYTSILQDIEKKVPVKLLKFTVTSSMDRPFYGVSAGDVMTYNKGVGVNPLDGNRDQAYVPAMAGVGDEEVRLHNAPPLVNIDAVKGDVITLVVSIPAGYVLATNLMKSFGELASTFAYEVRYSDETETKMRIIFTVPYTENGAETIQFASYYVGKNASFAPEPIEFVGIGMPNAHGITWAKNRTMLATTIDGTKYSTAQTHVIPRLFNAENAPHSPAQYDTLLPPMNLIIHPYLSVMGYVNEDLRVDGFFEPGVENAPMETTEFDSIWFSHDKIPPKDEYYDVYTAIWKMKNTAVFTRMRSALREITEAEAHTIAATVGEYHDLRVVGMEDWNEDAVKIRGLTKVETLFRLENPMGRLQDAIAEKLDPELVSAHLIPIPTEAVRVEVYWDPGKKEFLANLWEPALITPPDPEEPEPEPEEPSVEVGPDSSEAETSETQTTDESIDTGVTTEGDETDDPIVEDTIHEGLTLMSCSPISLVDLEKQNEILAPGTYKAIFLCTPNYEAHVVDFGPDTGAEGEIIPVIFEVMPIDITAMLHYHGTPHGETCAFLKLTKVDFSGLLPEHTLALNGDPSDERLGIVESKEELPDIEETPEPANTCHCTPRTYVLEGEWAPYYNLLMTDNEVYENVVIEAYLTHKDFSTPIPIKESLVRSDTYQIPRGVASEVHLMVPADGLITDVLLISFPDEGDADAIALAHPEGNHMVFNPAPQTIREGCTVIIRNGEEEHELVVTVITDRDVRFVMKVEHEDESLQVCKRCDGYIDTSVEPYTNYLEWVPDCKKYEPNKSVIL